MKDRVIHIQISSRVLIIALALIALAATAIPAGVTAATGSVNIQDPSTGSKARVDSGRLRVGDGGGSLTVDPTFPNGAFSRTTSVFFSTAVLGPFAPGVRIGISSVTLTNYYLEGSDYFSFVVYDAPSTGGSCSPKGAVRGTQLSGILASEESFHLPFPQPLVVPFSSQTNRWCLWMSPAETAWAIETTIVGFR